MKFIHCADLHLDSKMESLPSEKSKIRREEIVRTFERLVDFAVENFVVAIIISGDMFDTKRVTSKTKERIISKINDNKNLDFIYLPGNHDDINFISEIEQIPVNLKVVTDKWSKFKYDNVVVSSIKLTAVNALTSYDDLILNEDEINIVALHGQIADYKSSESAEKISLPKLKDKYIDYLALGHIHNYSNGQLDLRGKYAYCGCLDGRGFDETGDKGFVLLNIENGKVFDEFVSFSSRRLAEYEFSVANKESWIEVKNEIITYLEKNEDKSSLIKVVLTGEHEIDFNIDKEGLLYRLSESFFFCKVVDKTELKIQTDDFLLDKSVRGEFVRLVFESDLTSEEKQRVIMCGINALKGEDF